MSEIPSSLSAEKFRELIAKGKPAPLVAKSTLSFFVAGTPAPGGSKTAFALRRRDGSLVTRPNGAPVINMTDAGGEGNKQWRKDCAMQAKVAMRGCAIFQCALHVRFEFRVARPKAHFRANGDLRENAPKFPTGRPDVLKLSRSTEDALTEIVWIDDALIVREEIAKVYAAHPIDTGCQITISVMETQEQQSELL